MTKVLCLLTYTIDLDILFKEEREGDKIPRCNVTCVDVRAGKFHVKGSGEAIYNVSFGSPGEMPCCSCPDFTKHQLPCKHFFSVFNLHDQWSWASLPTQYLSSPYMSIDWPAIRHYFNLQESTVKIKMMNHNQVNGWIV